MKKNITKFLTGNLLVPLIMLVAICGTSLSAYASGELAEASELSLQKRKVSGTVYDTGGEAVAGARVVNKAKTYGVITGGDGKFEIEVEKGDVLEVEYLGMITVSITITDDKVYNVTMKEKATEIDEVTVVAFQKQKKESVISSITTINTKDLKIPSSDLTTAFAGKMAGMIAYQRSGEPGVENTDFFIRGVTTFGYKKDPLILLDGNEISSGDLSRLQPDDIASFSIMKDATATSLYGSRGANGVILVTTKEGAEGKAKINLRIESALSMPTREIELADPVTYMLLHNEAVRTRSVNGETLYTPQKIAQTRDGSNPYVYPANDWYNMLFNDYAINTRVNFNVSGGGQIAKYYVAATFNNDTGLLNSSGTNNFNNNINNQRYSLRANVNINVTKTTEAVVRLQGIFDQYVGPIESGDDLYAMVLKSNPVFFPAYFEPDEANKYTKHVMYGNKDSDKYMNPYAKMTRGYKDNNRSDMFAQFEVKQKLDFITEGMNLRAMFNTDRYSTFKVSRGYNPFYYSVSSYDKASDKYVLQSLNETAGTDYLELIKDSGDKEVKTTVYFEAALSWDRTYNDKHTLGALFVTTLRNHLVSNPADLQLSLPFRNNGYAGRLTYGYDSKYFVELNFGYNGSERFSEAERFGFFPSAGIGWIVSQEKFMEPLKRTISKLKLKGTFGLVGNDQIGSQSDRFFYMANVDMNNSGRGASFGTYGNSLSTNKINGISVSRYPNDQITWETAQKLNIGVELGLWDALDIQVDYFDEYRSNILMERKSIPSTMGLQSAVRANIGEATSRGFDASVNYNYSFNRDLWVSALGNFTYASSKFKVFEEPDYKDAPWKSQIGYSLSQQWGLVAERLFVDEVEVNNSPTQFGQYGAGDIKYKDINKDGKITDLDMVPIGFPTDPEIIYGFGVSAGYKNWDFSCFFQGSARSSFWIDPSKTAPFIDDQNALLKVYADSHWSEENRDIYALWPRLSNKTVENNTKRSTWFMRDGSFMRMKSLELGYSLPKSLISKIKLTNCRVYFSGTNLFSISKFDLWDPEMAGDGFKYPIQQVYNIGLQLSF